MDTVGRDYNEEKELISSEVEELHARMRNIPMTTEDVYQFIRIKCLQRLSVRDLGIGVVLKTLREIRQRNEKHFVVTEAFVMNNMLSYAQIGEMFGISKQRVYAILKGVSSRYEWIERLMEIKATEDSRNENNRSIFFAKKRMKA